MQLNDWLHDHVGIWPWRGNRWEIWARNLGNLVTGHWVPVLAKVGRERHAVLGHREWKDGEEGGDKIVVKKKWEQVGLYKWTFDINSECWIYMQD